MQLSKASLDHTVDGFGKEEEKKVDDEEEDENDTNGGRGGEVEMGCGRKNGAAVARSGVVGEAGDRRGEEMMGVVLP